MPFEADLQSLKSILAKGAHSRAKFAGVRKVIFCNLIKKVVIGIYKTAEMASLNSGQEVHAIYSLENVYDSGRYTSPMTNSTCQIWVRST